MNNSGEIPTWSLLQELGFEPDADVISDVLPGLRFEFGNFQLAAACLTNFRWEQVVQLYGVLVGNRCFGEVKFEMPRHVASRQLGIAWIVWHLDKASDEEYFRPRRKVPWLDEGRRHTNLLPWEVQRAEDERQMAEYAARPRCQVQRDWLKLALKTLAAHLHSVDDGVLVEFSFDGTVLSIKCADGLIVAAATGKSWPAKYLISAKAVRNLPKRLMDEQVDVSVWESQLRIDRLAYRGIIVVPANSDESPHENNH